jgi:hypothetical protein
VTIHVVAAEIFVLSRAHVPLGTLQVPADDFLNWTTYPVPLPLHDTSTPPEVMVLATADTADAVPDAEADADADAVADAEADVDVDADDDDVGEGDADADSVDAGTSPLMTGALLSGALPPVALPALHAARTVTMLARSADATVHFPTRPWWTCHDRAWPMCAFPHECECWTLRCDQQR